jgi:phage tail P2-like protein
VATIRKITVISGGSGYSLAPTVVISGDGVGAVGFATLLGSSLGYVQVLDGGRGYTNASVTIVPAAGDAGSGATASVSLAPSYDEHLLPSNSTPLEQALAAVTQVVNKIPVPIEPVWRVNECPQDLLPWLAWALSVDDWNTTWTEAQKRQQIKDSIANHRKKGTRVALDIAVAPYQSYFSFQEWWEYAAPAYHYRFRGEVPLGTWPDLTLLNRVWDVALNVKNVRSYPDPILIEARSDPAKFYVTPFCVQTIRASNRPVPVTSVSSPPATIFWGSFVRMTTIMRVGL